MRGTEQTAAQRAGQTKRERSHQAAINATVELLAEGDNEPSFAAIARRSGVSLTTLRKVFPGRDAIVAAARKRLESVGRPDEHPAEVIVRALQIGVPKTDWEEIVVRRGAELAEAAGALVQAGQLRGNLSVSYLTPEDKELEVFRAVRVDEARRGEALMLRGNAGPHDRLMAAWCLLGALADAGYPEETLDVAGRVITLATEIGHTDFARSARFTAVAMLSWTDISKAIIEARKPLPDGTIDSHTVLFAAGAAWFEGKQAEANQLLGLVADPEEFLWEERAEWHLYRNEIVDARRFILDPQPSHDPLIALLVELAADRRESIRQLIDTIEAMDTPLSSATARIAERRLLERAKAYLESPDQRKPVPERIVNSATASLQKAISAVRQGGRIEQGAADEIARLCQELRCLIETIPDAYLEPENS